VRILHSYRWRRRLIITAIVCSITGPLIYLGVLYSSPGNPENANGPTVPDYVQPTHAPFTPAKRRAVRKVLKRFIASAVVRRDVSRSWDLAAQSLREGVSRKQWNRGDIPVVPYPAANKGWGDWSDVKYSYRNTVGLEVFLFPQKGSGYSDMTAEVELVRARDGAWRVDYWMPVKFHGPASTAPADSTSALKEGPPNVHKLPGKKAVTRAQAKALRLKHAHAAKVHQRAAQAEGESPQQTPHNRGAWWAIPLALLGLAVVLPISIGIGVWWRNKRAMRDYLRSVGTR
jgi:hypothetical protein